MKFRKVRDPPNFVFWHYEIVDSSSKGGMNYEK